MDDFLTNSSALSQQLEETTTLKSRSEIVEWLRLAEETVYLFEKMSNALGSAAKDAGAGILVEIIGEVFKTVCSTIKDGIKSIIAQAKGKAPAKKE